jgi:hypothetical protein
MVEPMFAVAGDIFSQKKILPVAAFRRRRSRQH